MTLARTNSDTKPPASHGFLLVWLALVALSAVLFIHVGRTSPPPAKRMPFRRTTEGWQALPPLDGVEEVQVSDTGVVWARSAAGLHRLSGGSWRAVVTPTGLESALPYFRCAFALDGDDLWAATSSAVVHFDGRGSARYKEALATSRPASIAARHGQVWVIDQVGNLSHFDGSRWTIGKVTIPVNWRVSYPNPHLAITANGALWIAIQGLWRYDGQSWTRVPGASAKAQYLGATPAAEYVENGTKIQTSGAVWMRDGTAVLEFNAYGSLWARHFPLDVGLPANARVDAVSGRPPGIALASGFGLSWFDGAGWHADLSRPLGLEAVSGVAVAPDQSIWGVGYPYSPPQSGTDLLLAAAGLILPMLAVVCPLFWSGRAPLKYALASIALVGLVAVIMINYPDYLVVLRIVAILRVAPIIAVLLLILGYHFGRCFRVERQLKKAQYDRARKMLDGFLRWPSTTTWQLLRANVLFYADQLLESESILRAIPRIRRELGVKVLVSEDLGRVLMAQGRYQEAEDAFLSAAALMPDRSPGPNGLAELRLRQGIEPEQALEYAQQAVRLYQDSTLEHTVKHRLPAIRANQAWALAVLGRADQAQKAIQTARAALDRRHIPETAAFHWRAGMTMLTLGETSAAESHFRAAVTLDPRGYYGKLAARQPARDPAPAPGF